MYVRNRLLYGKLWLAALSLAYVNSQLLEFYESQSPFSTESVNPSVSRAIKTNKLKPSTNYWETLQTRSTYVTNQGRQGQNLNSFRRPKHYSSTQIYQTPATYVENYDVTSEPYPTKSSVKPYTPRHSYEGHFNVDYELQAISKSKYENSYKKETHHQAAYDPYDISRPNLKVVHNQEWKAEAGPRYPSDGNNYHSKVPPRYPSENYETPSRYRDSRYNESRSYCNPDAPPACFDYRFGMCVEDNSYPEDDIRVALEHFMVRNRLPDPLAILNDEPTTPTPAHLLIPDDTLPGVCPFSSARITPIRVKNTDGRWRIIVQRYGEVVQRENVVVCERRSYGEEAACSKDGRHEVRLQVSALARSCFRYYCNQLKAVKRYLAFDPCDPAKGLFVDSFPMPSACSCRLNRVIC